MTGDRIEVGAETGNRWMKRKFKTHSTPPSDIELFLF
jgi:hypothetical protein